MQSDDKVYYITLQTIMDEDWKTQLAKGYPSIPEGEKVLYVKTIKNLYGEFIRVKWNNTLYDTVPWKIRRVKTNES